MTAFDAAVEACRGGREAAVSGGGGHRRRRVLLAFAAAPWLVASQPSQAQPGAVSGGAPSPAGHSAAAAIDTVTIGKSRIRLQFVSSVDDRLRGEALDWVKRSADAVAGYFGRFPAAEVDLQVLPTDDPGIHGSTFATPGLLIRLRVGRATTPAQFRDDWVLVHEMVHLAVPDVPVAQNWLHEGIATYVESVARGRAGLITAEQVWHEFFGAMPQGQPQRGDRGLDHTPTWGRTYWGGAMFCLLGDVALLEGSGGRAGLRHALRGVLDAGGGYAVAWPVTRTLAVADAAVGQTVLTKLYERSKASVVPADLDGLWRRLGVTPGVLRDDAPLAALRRAIVS